MNTKAASSQTGEAANAVLDLDFMFAILRYRAAKMDAIERAAMFQKLKNLEEMFKGVTQFCAFMEMLAEQPSKH